MRTRVLGLALALVAITGTVESLPAATTVHRVVDGERVELDATLVNRVLPNDTIGVGEEQRAPAFSIVGHVRHPGRYELIDDITVGQAIAIAGGLTTRGDKDRIRIVRTVDGKRVEIPVAPQDPVLPDDTIEVLAAR